MNAFPSIFALGFGLSAVVPLMFPVGAAAETFGAKFSRCVVDEQRKPNYNKDEAWARCQKSAEAERALEIRQSESQGPNMRLLKPAYAFQFCVKTQTANAMALVTPARFANVSDAESFVWRSVIDKCFPVFAIDEFQALIYQNYQGSDQRMVDYRDGLLWYARAAVFSEVKDWYSTAKR
ncbi:MAG: hypothetical protein Q8K29_17430 [Polaromonas sp.]|nr:hypothetical protein [Polaromonas sp.]